MLTEVKNNIKLIFICFKYNLLRATNNRITFISQIIGMILNNGIMIFQWIVMFSLKDNIGGYAFDDVLILWGLASATYGVANVFFYNANALSSIINMGKLDSFLIQPKNVLLNVCSAEMKVSALGDILFGFIMLIVAKANIVVWPLFILFAVTGGIIISAMGVIYNSLSFYFGNVEEIAMAMNNALLNVSTYPSGIFSERTKWLFMTLVPVTMSVYIPIDILLHKAYNMIPLVLLFTIVLVIIANILFTKGLKKYSSSNLMIAKI